MVFFDKNNVLTWWLLILFSVTLFGQSEDNNQDILELEKSVASIRRSKPKLEALRKLADHYLYTDSKKCSQFAKQGITIAHHANLSHWEAFFLTHYGKILMVSGQYYSSIDTLKSALDIAKDLQDTTLTEIYNILGINYQYLEQSEQAITSYLKAIELSTKFNLPHRAFYPIGNLADYYRQQKDLEKSIYYLREALKIANRLNQHKPKAFIYKDYSFLLIQVGKLDSAEIIANKAIYYAEQVGNYPYIASDAYVNKSIIALEAKAYPAALQYAQKAKAIAEQVNAKKFIIRANKSLARIYLAMNNFVVAKKLANDILQDVIQSSVNDELINCHVLLKDIYVKQNDFKKAFETQLSIDSIKQSFFDLQKANYKAHEEQKFEQAINRSKIELIQAQSNIEMQLVRKNGAFLISLLMFATIVISILFWISKNELVDQSISPNPHENFEITELDIRNQYIAQISVAGCIMLAFSILYLLFWGPPLFVWIAIIPFLLLGSTYLFAKRQKIKLTFFTGLIYYPYFVLTSLYFGLGDITSLMMLTIFVVITFVSNKRWMHVTNIFSVVFCLIVIFYLGKYIVPWSPIDIPGFSTIAALISFSTISITFIYFNKNLQYIKSELWKKHQFLSQISNLNPHFIFAKDLQGHFTFTNQALEHTFDLPQGSLIGKTHHSLSIQNKDNELFSQEDQAVLSSGKTIHRKNQKIVTDNGTTHWYDTVKQPIFDKSGAITGVLGVSTEVTDRLKAENALIHSKKQFQTLIEASPNGTVTVDTKGHIDYASPKVFELFGYQPDQMINQPILHFIQSAAHEKLIAKHEALFSGKSDVVIDEVVGVHQNGQPIYLEGFSKLIQLNEDQPPHLLIIFKDISQQVATQRILNEQHAIYEALITGSFDAIDIIEIYQLDKEQGLQGQVVIRNEIMQYYTRSAEDLVIAHQDIIPISPTYQPNGRLSKKYGKEVFEQFLEFNYVQFEWALLTMDGQTVVLEIIKQLIEVNGKKLIMRVAKDITQQKKQRQIIEYQLTDLQQKKQELEKYIASNLELENFAYIASHDLRAPIRTIISFSQLLLKSASNKLEDRELEFLHFIIRSSQNMNALISDLLTYSKVNSSKLNLEELNLNDVVTDVTEDLQSIITEKSGKIVTHHLPERITIDGVKIRQLLQNLISNSIKFSKKDEHPIIEIGCQEDINNWQLYIKDNGIGISSEYYDRIFLLFKRLHNSKDYEGTGIGLAICKEIVSQHQGRIWVESTEHVGTTFYFTISKSLVKKPAQVDLVNS